MITAIYCDGGCVRKNPSEIGGTWAWVAVEEVLPDFALQGMLEEVSQVELGGVDSKAKYVKSDSGFVPNSVYGVEITNNIMEYEAVVRGLESMDDGWSGVVYSDSLITLQRIFGTWRNKNLPKMLIERKDKVMKRLGKVTCKHVDGHPTKKQLAEGLGKRGNIVSKWNIMADELCQKQSLIKQGKISDDSCENILQY
jgi:ribonuclease HI